MRGFYFDRQAHSLLQKKMGKWLDIFNRAARYDEKQARRDCGALCEAAPEQPRLKTIAAVGAYDAVIGGDRADSRRLTAIMSYLLRSGVLIDPDFSIDIVNLSDKRDFLSEDKKYDLVFVSFILHAYHRGTFVYSDRSLQKNMSSDPRRLRNFYGLALSKNHNHGLWQDKMSSCAAKMIATYGGSDEIGTQTLCGPRNAATIIPLIETPDKRVCDYSGRRWNRYLEPDLESGVDLGVLYNNAANDLPMPWLGFAAERAYLQTIAGALSPRTSLGQKGRMIGRGGG